MQSETTESYIVNLLDRASENFLKSLPGKNDVDVQSTTAPADPKFGDYASNLALVLAKPLKKSPKELAESIIAELTKLDEQKRFESIEAVGGFINFKLSSEYLLKNLQDIIDQRDLYGCSVIGKGAKILVEYFQPNVAKPLHLGHLRTAIIGDSLFKILASQGFKVESDTHLGDWGTQFGILIWAYKNLGGRELLESHPNDKITALNSLYVDANAQVKENQKILEGGKVEFVKLEKGDKENRKLWKEFRDWSWQEFSVVYDDLAIRKSGHDWPESFYEDKMPAVIDELKFKQLLVESQGAQIVNLENYNLGIALVVKSDGGTTYLLRDLATFIYRKSQGFKKQLYVVDVRQAHTLAQTFKILELAGHLQAGEAQHISYGFLTLPEGAMSTRKGTVLGASNFIHSVQQEVLKVIEEKNPKLVNKAEVAKSVAAGAIKYFDLSHNIKSDIVFDPKKAIAFEGNTGPYLQYTHARIQGILRKSSTDKKIASGTPVVATGMTIKEQEILVLRKLVKFTEIVEQVAKDYLPNLLCNYLFELAQTFNAFYQEVPVLQETDEKLRLFRLSLITATAQVIRNGLYLLGIEAPEEM